MNTLSELWGLPGTGKTHAAVAGWPDAILVDTAFTSMGFREMEIDEDPNEKGESWPVHLKVHEYDYETAEEKYHYLGEFPDGTDFAEGHRTVIVDNAADLRVLAANKWCQQNDQEWPQQAQWGKINDMLDRFFRELKRDHHVVVISQMKDEYQNDVKTGEKTRDGPKRMDYKADFRLFCEVDDGERHIHVKKNRHVDPASDQYGSVGSDLGGSVTFEDLMLYSEIPESEWEVEAVA